MLLCLPSGVAVIDNLVYAVGGSNRDDGTRSNLNSMERYNPERDEWEDLPPMHRSRGAASVTALNGCLYAVGGYDSGQCLSWEFQLLLKFLIIHAHLCTHTVILHLFWLNSLPILFHIRNFCGNRVSTVHDFVFVYRTMAV